MNADLSCTSFLCSSRNVVSMSMRSSDLIARRTCRSRSSCHSRRSRPTSPEVRGRRRLNGREHLELDVHFSRATQALGRFSEHAVELLGIRGRQSFGHQRHQFAHAARCYARVMNGRAVDHREHLQPMRRNCSIWRSKSVEGVTEGGISAVLAAEDLQGAHHKKRTGDLSPVPRLPCPPQGLSACDLVPDRGAAATDRGADQGPLLATDGRANASADARGRPDDDRALLDRAPLLDRDRVTGRRPGARAQAPLGRSSPGRRVHR